MALLLEYYQEFPKHGDETNAAGGVARLKKAMATFQRKVSERYNEGTLQRLLECSHAEMRQAAVLALGLIGSMDSNAALAAMLRDADRVVRRFAADALSSVWFRGDSRAINDELQRLIRLSEAEKALAGMTRLIKKSPSFAEAYNQRAILYFRLGQYQRSITDCERALHLNRYHFGAQAGMAQCYIKLRKPRPALRALRSALKINPGLEGVAETIRALEEVLGEEEKKDDKK